MLERKVEGVAVMTFGEEEPVLDQLVHRNVPIVLAEFKLDDPKASTILIDYSTGIRAAVNHLAKLGHSRIAFLAGPHKLHSAITRENDFRAAMKAAGLAIQKKWVIECDHTLKGGVAGYGQLQALAPRPTAIVCSNDMTAIGVLRAAYMDGLRVPQDLSVIGLDDIDFAEFTLPPLTTIRLSRADLARAAFEALRQQAEDPGNPRNATRVPGLHQPRGPRIDREAESRRVTGNLRLVGFSLMVFHGNVNEPGCNPPQFVCSILAGCNIVRARAMGSPCRRQRCDLAHCMVARCKVRSLHALGRLFHPRPR